MVEWGSERVAGVQERFCGVGQTSLHGGGGLPTWRVGIPYVEGWGSLHGVSGGAVGAGFAGAVDGAATGDVAELDAKAP